MALMPPHGRVPRFQRELRHRPNYEKTPSFDFEPLSPGMAAQCADNLSLLVTILFSENVDILRKSRAAEVSLSMPQEDLYTRRLLRKIFISTCFSPTTASISMYYLYCFICDATVSAFSKHDLLVAALMLSNKMFDDTHMSTSKWSHICQIPSSRLASAEQILLASLKWKLHLSSDEFYKWGAQMHRFLKQVRM